MNEIRVDPSSFYNAGNRYADRLFWVAPNLKLRDVLVLETCDGVATEAILPIEEYRRLKALEAGHRGP